MIDRCLRGELMSLQIGDVYARIGLQIATGQFNTASQAFRSLGYDAIYLAKRMKDANDSSDGLGKSFTNLPMKIKPTTIAMAGLVTVLAGLGAAVSVGKQVVDTASTFELLNIRIKSVSKDAKNFSDNMNFIRKTAIDTPMSIEGVTRAFADMSVVGIDARKALLPVIDSLTAVGGTSADLHPVIRSLTQIVSKGRVSMEELSRELGNRGIPALSMLQKHFKTNATSADEWAKIIPHSKDAVYALAEEMTKAFGGAAQDRMDTFAGYIEKIGDAFQFALLDIANTGLFNSIKNDMADFKDEFDELMQDKSASGFAAQVGSSLIYIKDAFIGMLPSLDNGAKGLILAFKGVALIANAVSVAVNAVAILIKGFMSGLNVFSGFVTFVMKGVVDAIYTVLDTLGLPESVLRKFGSASEFLGNQLAFFSKNANDYAISMGDNFDSGGQAILNIGKILSGTNADMVESSVVAGRFGSALFDAGNQAETTAGKLGRLSREANKASSMILSVFKDDAPMIKETVNSWIDTKSMSAASVAARKVVEDMNKAIVATNLEYSSRGLANTAEAENARVELYKAAQGKIDKIFDDSAKKQQYLNEKAIKSLEQQTSISLTKGQTAMVGNNNVYDNALFDYQSKEMQLNLDYQTGNITSEELQAQKDLAIAVRENTISQGLWSDAESIGSAIGSNVGGAVSAIGDIFSGNWGGAIASSLSLMAENSPEMAEALSKINEFVGKVFAILGKVLAPIFKALGKALDGIEPLLEVVGEILEPIGEIVGDIFSTMIDAMQPVFKLIASILQAIKPVLDLILSAVEPVADLLRVIGNIVKSIGNIGGNLMDFVTDIPVIGDVFDVVGDVFGGLFHDGGSVGAPFKYHGGASVGLPSGTFKPDEVPAVLQTGEIVLDRATVNEAKNGRSDTQSDMSISAESQLLLNMLKELRNIRKMQEEWNVYGLNVARV